MSTKRAILTQGQRLTNGGRPSGWYPDPNDTGGLRYWNGRTWTEHRARLAIPANNQGPAVCTCGVVATGSCRVCSRPFCRTHIFEQDRDDRAYLARWEAWTCVGCIEDAQRAIRTTQLQRCEDVALQLALRAKLKGLRTVTGHRPRVVSLFHRSKDSKSRRPGRHDNALLIQYDGDSDEPTYAGLAITADGRRVYDVGAPVVGVRRDRFGPKRTITGYSITEEITIERLRHAATRPTKENWFEFAARVYLRAGARLGVHPLPPPGESAVPATDAGIDAELEADMQADMHADMHADMQAAFSPEDAEALPANSLQQAEG